MLRDFDRGVGLRCRGRSAGQKSVGRSDRSLRNESSVAVMKGILYVAAPLLLARKSHWSCLVQVDIDKNGRDYWIQLLAGRSSSLPERLSRFFLEGPSSTTLGGGEGFTKRIDSGGSFVALQPSRVWRSNRGGGSPWASCLWFFPSILADSEIEETKSSRTALAELYELTHCTCWTRPFLRCAVAEHPEGIIEQ